MGRVVRERANRSRTAAGDDDLALVREQRWNLSCDAPADRKAGGGFDEEPSPGPGGTRRAVARAGPPADSHLPGRPDLVRGAHRAPGHGLRRWFSGDDDAAAVR